MPKRFSRVKALVVDDHPKMRQILITALRGFGLTRTREAGDATTAFDVFRSDPPDLLLIDYLLLGGTGLDLVRAIRRLDGPQRFAPIIMVSGHSDLTKVTEARDAGVTEYLAKPVTAAGILTRLEAVINRPRAFVVAPTYIGPDRRRRGSPGYDGPMRRDSDLCQLSID